MTYKKVPMDVTSRASTISNWPVVHSSMIPNQVLNFYGTDSQERYIENLKDKEWSYKDSIISYVFNNQGLRMHKNIEDVSKDYFISFGCSNTVGIGLALEDTWPYQVSKNCGIDYINSAVVGSSVKLNCINFFNMLNTVDYLPKAVIFAWPNSARYAFYNSKEFLFYLPNHIPLDSKFKKFNSVYQELLSMDFNIHEAAIYRNMIKTTCQRIGINYIDFSFENDEFTRLENVTTISSDRPDYARDCSHYGIVHHNNAVQLIEQFLI